MIVLHEQFFLFVMIRVPPVSQRTDTLFPYSSRFRPANLTAIGEDQPDSWIARNDLAWMLYEKGDYAAARPHAERANELAANNPAVMDTLGVILLELGETTKATALLRRASESIPDNPEIGVHLARAYALGDRKDEARTLLSALLEIGRAHV